MKQITIEPTYRDVMMFFVLTVGLVCVANLGVWYYLKEKPVNRAVSRVGQKWQMIEYLPRPVDWVVLGDSSCGQGIRPDILATELGGTAANFCTVANATVVNDAWMLQRYIEKFGPPKGVVLFHVFHVWERNADDFVKLFGQIPLQGNFWRHYEPAIALPLIQEIELIFSPFMSLWNSNLSVQQLLYGLGQRVGQKKVPHSYKTDAENDLEFLMRHSGFVEEKVPRPEKVERDIKTHIMKYSQAKFTISEVNLLALRVIIKNANKYRFPLFISNSSIAAGLYRDIGIKRFFSEMKSMLEEETIRGKAGLLVLQDPPQYLPEQMDNVDHVIGAENAADLTHRLAAAIRAVKQ